MEFVWGLATFFFFTLLVLTCGYIMGRMKEGNVYNIIETTVALAVLILVVLWTYYADDRQLLPCAWTIALSVSGSILGLVLLLFQVLSAKWNLAESFALVSSHKSKRARLKEIRKTQPLLKLLGESHGQSTGD